MTVYFVYRSHYDNPTGLHVKRFPKDDTVLDWFGRHWKVKGEKECYSFATQLLGRGVYGLPSLFARIGEESLAPPRTMAARAETLQENGYIDSVLHGPHLLQVFTDNDELEMAYYFFDAHFLASDGTSKRPLKRPVRI
jgi:hypothetical protein